MDQFLTFFGPVLALCAGVMILAVFFTLLGYVKRLTSRAGWAKVKGFLKDGTWVNVHLSGGQSYLRVRFVGFIHASSHAGIPYPLSHMLVCENAQGARILIRPGLVRVIEQVEPPP